MSILLDDGPPPRGGRRHFRPPRRNLRLGRLRANRACLHASTRTRHSRISSSATRSRPILRHTSHTSLETYLLLRRTSLRLIGALLRTPNPLSNPQHRHRRSRILRVPLRRHQYRSRELWRLRNPPHPLCPHRIRRERFERNGRDGLLVLGGSEGVKVCQVKV